MALRVQGKNLTLPILTKGRTKKCDRKKSLTFSCRLFCESKCLDHSRKKLRKKMNGKKKCCVLNLETLKGLEGDLPTAPVLLRARCCEQHAMLAQGMCENHWEWATSTTDAPQLLGATLGPTSMAWFSLESFFSNWPPIQKNPEKLKPSPKNKTAFLKEWWGCRNPHL